MTEGGRGALIRPRIPSHARRESARQAQGTIRLPGRPALLCRVRPEPDGSSPASHVAGLRRQPGRDAVLGPRPDQPRRTSGASRSPGRTTPARRAGSRRIPSSSTASCTRRLPSTGSWRSTPPPARCAGGSIRRSSAAAPNRGVTYWAERRRQADLHGPGPLPLRDRRAHRAADPGLRPRGPDRPARGPGAAGGGAVGPPHHSRHRLQGPPDRRRPRRRGAARVARGRPRVRREDGEAAVDFPHHPASRRGRLRDLAEGRLEGERRRQQLGGHGASTSGAGSSTCPRDPRPRISTGRTARATTCSRTRSSPSTPRPASGSGTSRRCATTSGTATSPLLRAWSPSGTAAAGSTRWPRPARRDTSTCSTARTAAALPARGPQGPARATWRRSGRGHPGAARRSPRPSPASR